MSVYRLNYRAYTGKVTPLWMRILVIARYGFNEGFMVVENPRSGLFVLSLLPPHRLPGHHLSGQQPSGACVSWRGLS